MGCSSSGESFFIEIDSHGRSVYNERTETPKGVRSLKDSYAFSVVTAVYNAAPFLPETYESLLKQDIGFSRIQWILCDDGSADESPALCDRYAEAHPDNVVVIHKENGGVSSARNACLPHIRGKYVSFLDADDCLSRNAFSKVYDFFEAHPETDVVSLPMIFFDGKHGPHILNRKYRKGTRVIDLTEAPDNPQLAVTSAFVRAEALRGKSFDTNLSYAEDAKLLQSILIEKKTLGVVADAIHHYRRRSAGEVSAIQNSGNSKAWYFPYLEHFCKDTLEMCMERLGEVPRFIQYTIAYDLQWRIRQRTLPSVLFDETEKEAYRRLLSGILAYIDDYVLAKQRDIHPYQRVHALYLKHGTQPVPAPEKGEHEYRYGDEEPFWIKRDRISVEFFHVKDGQVVVECSALHVFGFDAAPPEILAEANGIAYHGVRTDRKKEELSLDEPIAHRYGFTFTIPIPEKGKPLNIRFLLQTENGIELLNSPRLTKFFPISEKYKNAYACIGDRVLTYRNHTLTFSKRRFRFFREIRFDWEILRKQGRDNAARNAVLGRLCYAVVKPFVRKPIWILSDRTAVAGDNGEAMFRYLNSLPQKDVRLYFAVSDQCPDYEALKKIGRVVRSKSYRHKMLYLLSDLNISSHADSDIVSQFPGYNQPYRDIESRIRFVFLQHGITKDDLSDWLNRFNCNIAGLVTAARPEAESFRTGAYFYPDEVIWLTGFPRFDRLYHDEKRCITIMPTWRRAWSTAADPKTGVRNLREGFEEGEFFCFYNKLLNDARLLDAAKRNGYTVRFLPHPTLQPHIDRFTQNTDVAFLHADTPYRKVFAESDLILTDYSSVAFDFAYLRKPVVYTQFDREEFFSGEHVYVKGYFDYERDGFGEVETDYDATVDRLIEYMENGCKLKDEYRARIDGFFVFDDRNNCRRVYEKLRELEAKMKR